MKQMRWITGLCGLVCVLGLAGCSGDGGGGAISSNGTSGATTGGTGGGSPCATSAECGGELCVDGRCQGCAEDAACAGDPTYGAGATCGAGGGCVPCLGELGCGCDAGACAGDLVCAADLCEEPTCPEGEEGCVCLSNQTCADGLRCEAEVCAPCPAGSLGCGCGADDACEGGLACMDGLCVEESCVAGELGCPCQEAPEAACAEGLTCSDGGMCAECAPDIEGCPCNAEGACQGDLVCDEEEVTCRATRTCEELGCAANQLCQAEEVGVDAACLEACAEGFTYNADTGVCDVVPMANCEPGAPGSILAGCMEQHRACVEEVVGASCGACLSGFVADGGPMGACRAALACDDLGCGDANRACEEGGDTSDASCGACLDGFEPNMAGACERVVLTCATHPSAASMCEAERRACVDGPEGPSCGACVAEFTEEGGACVPVRRCADLGCADLGLTCDGEPLAACGGCLEGLIPNNPEDVSAGCREALTCDQVITSCSTDQDCAIGACVGADGACGDGEEGCACSCGDGRFCVNMDEGDAACLDWPCTDFNGDPDETQAFRRDTGACVSCDLACEGEGDAGGIWPFTLENSNRCICATRPGYYVDTGGNFASRRCDADSDGWVRTSARSALVSRDPVLRTNARCDLKTIDRFVLENEYRQRFEVKLCVEGLVGSFACEVDDDCELGRCDAGVCDCVEPNPIDLYESVRNDDQGDLDRVTDIDAPAYRDGMRGRRLRAAELNPLTRACVSATGDYNDNSIADLSEHHGMIPEQGSVAEQAFAQLSFFVELAEGMYDRDLGEEFGRFVIRERSRCDAGFPLQMSDAIDGPYWRSCTRNRDALFNADNPQIGYDFARWSCPAGAETCVTPPPLTDVTPSGGDVPPHGLCDEGITLPPADGVWRGMSHHSQFKCNQIVNTIPADRDTAQPQLRTLAELATADGVSGAYQLNVCTVACPEGDLDCAADCEGATCAESSASINNNPDSPILTCRPLPREEALEGMVGFSAVRYTSHEAYTRGCINEWRPASPSAEYVPWRAMCPGFLNSLETTGGDGACIDDSNCPAGSACTPAGCVDAASARITGAGNPGNFGQIVCGCGFNYGGPECDRGCPGDVNCQGEACAQNQLFYGGDVSVNDAETCDRGYCPVLPDGEGGGRRGWWVCGAWSSTSYETDPAQGPRLSHVSGWTASGDVAENGIGKVPLCETDEDCATGWSSR